MNLQAFLLKKESNNKSLAEMLSIWDRQLAKEGAKLFLKRLDFVQKISPIASEIHKHLTSGKETLDIVYQSEMQGRTKQEAEDFLVQKLADTFDKQIKLGFTTSGVHRDDIKVCLDGIDVRVYGSQGQQRTCALSLKLAELEIIKTQTRSTPVLLLDDVLSELDEKRKIKLLKFCSKAQTLISCTSFPYKQIECNKIVVKNGEVKY